MQDSGSFFGYRASAGDDDNEHHQQQYPAHHQGPAAGRPGRRRAADPDLPPSDGTLLPDTPTRAVRAPKPDASRPAEPTDTPPPGYGPADTPPADRFRWQSNVAGGPDNWSNYLGQATEPSPMDEPLIPELPTVPTFPGGPDSTYDRHGYPPETGLAGFGDGLGSDPLSGPYDDPLAAPTDQRPTSAPKAPAPGTAVESAMPSQQGHEPAGALGHPVLPFSENTGFFERPADLQQTTASRDRAAPRQPADPRDTEYGSPTVGGHLGGHTGGEEEPLQEKRNLRQPTTGRRSRRSLSTPTGGLPGWAAIIVSLACTAAAVLADLTLTRSVGVLFGLCFVLTAFGVAAGIRRTAMFTAGVLPPLAALAAFVALGTTAPERFVGDQSSGMLQIGSAILSGLGSSAWFLVAAWAVALGTIALRTARLPAPSRQPQG